MLCLCKAFSPSTRINELNATRGTVYQYIHKLKKRYPAKNERHLLYLRYTPIGNNRTVLAATERELEILALFVRGKPCRQIAKNLGIANRIVTTHLENLISRNKYQDADELVVMYADWEMQNAQKK